MDQPQTLKTKKETLFAVILGLGVFVVFLSLVCAYLYTRTPATKVVYDQDIITAKVQQALQRKNALYPDNDPLIYRSGDSVLSDWGNPDPDGFRPPSIDHLKPKAWGEKRVLIVGDSNTFGLGITDATKIFTGILNQTAKEKGLNVTFFNLSSPGWNMTNSMETISAFFSRLQPDVVIYQYTANDYYLSFYPYSGSYTTIWGYEPVINKSPFYTETDQGNFLASYSGRFPQQVNLSMSYVFHPLFRSERLKLGRTLKLVSQALAARHVPFIVFNLQPHVIYGLKVDPSLEESLVELGVEAEVWRNFTTYNAPPTAPYHPDEVGHRVLAGEIYYALRQQPIFASWPEIPEFKDYYQKGLKRYTSPAGVDTDAGLDHRYQGFMQDYAEESAANLQPTISFEPGHEQGMFQIFGRATIDGLVSNRVALVLPPIHGQPLIIRYEAPRSPLVEATPLRLRAYTENGEFFHDQLEQHEGSNEFKVALESRTPFILELDFDRVYYDAERDFPYSARIDSVGAGEAQPIGQARIGQDGWEPGGSGVTQAGQGLRLDDKGTLAHELEVPAGAWTLSGRVAVTAEQPKATVLVDLIWSKRGQEISRHTLTLEALKDKTTELPLGRGVPAGADRVRVSLHPWRDEDGAVTVGQASFSWY